MPWKMSQCICKCTQIRTLDVHSCINKFLKSITVNKARQWSEAPSWRETSQMSPPVWKRRRDSLFSETLVVEGRSKTRCVHVKINQRSIRSLINRLITSAELLRRVHSPELKLMSIWIFPYLCLNWMYIDPKPDGSTSLLTLFQTLFFKWIQIL